MIDTHSHLNFKDFANDYVEVWQRAQTAGVGAALVVGSQLETSRRAMEIAGELPDLYAAIGLHPIHATDENFEIENYRALFTSTPRPVAIGEIGLDYFHHGKEKFGALQEKILRQFLALAQELNLPCILHCRGAKKDPLTAYDDLLKILADYTTTRGVLHCFTADWPTAEKYLARGFYLGFTGVVTFAPEVAAVAAQAPLDRLLLETDCPYLAPAPRRCERCEPQDVITIARFIAAARNISLVKLEMATDRNARKLFDLS